MTDVVAAPNIIQQEEVSYKSSVSESVLTRIAASINYIISRIPTVLNYDYSGYYKATSIIDGQNGLRYFEKEVKISRYILTNDIAGSSGTSSINFEVYNASNVLVGNLFSVEPSIDSAAGDRAVVGRNITDSNDITNGVGNRVVGTLNLTVLPAGYSIRAVLSSAQTDARNLNFTLELQEQ